MIKNIFNFVKKKIPKISVTEMIALQSGNTSIDQSILEGKLVYPKNFVFKIDYNKKTNLGKAYFFLMDGSYLWILNTYNHVKIVLAI